MLATLLVFLVIASVIFSVIVIGVVWDVAFHDHPEKRDQLKWLRAWLPPFPSGKALRDWAVNRAVHSVAKRIEEGRDATLPKRLAEDIEAGASRAMTPHVAADEPERKMACPDGGQGVIGLSVPEVLAIADDLRRNLSRSEVRRIRDLAAENAGKSASLAVDQVAALRLPCPLQGPDHVCCTFPTRPLMCRPLHAVVLGGSPPLETESSEDSYARAVGEGIASGLKLGLQVAGLDAKRYELNSALARALDTPDAAQRWAKGDDVFAGCLTMPHHFAATAPTQNPLPKEDTSCFAI